MHLSSPKIIDSNAKCAKLFHRVFPLIFHTSFFSPFRGVHNSGTGNNWRLLWKKKKKKKKVFSARFMGVNLIGRVFEGSSLTVQGMRVRRDMRCGQLSLQNKLWWVKCVCFDHLGTHLAEMLRGTLFVNQHQRTRFWNEEKMYHKN